MQNTPRCKTETTMTEQLRLERKGHTAIITIKNPPANTWTEESLPALQAMVEELNADSNIYALVVTGEGPKFFSAGADLNVFGSGDKARARGMIMAFGRAFETLAQFRGVSIAAINGYAMGGGLEAALSCDLRIAEAHAVMALPEASVGLLPGGLGTQHLPWVVGEGWAKRMILCGERVDAETALRIGLVEEVVPTGEALAKALQWAENVAKQSPSSVKSCKKLIMAARKQPMWTALTQEREAFVDLFDTEDQQEGVSAFLEKRKPEWKNR
ncbi:enoyl-CoA hydratase [Burkholderiaceae bacterium DAT-1]|nr:enoyl-CoA hydratase [Burkholderiaceae bacterium DAT-1]